MEKMRRFRFFSLHFLLIYLTCGLDLVDKSTGDVSHLPAPYSIPNREFQGNFLDPGLPTPNCGKLVGKERECVEKIKKFEYRPFISILEQPYKVPVPDISYVNVIELKKRPFEVKVPRVSSLKVPIVHIKETPETVKITRIKEVETRVPILTTDVIPIPKLLHNPQVTDEPIQIPEIQEQQPISKKIVNYRVTDKTVWVDKFEVKPQVKYIKRPVVRRTVRYVNRTRIEYIPKIVLVPHIIEKTLRLPRPRINRGEKVFVEMPKVNNVTSTFEDEYPDQYEDYVMVDQVVKEPKVVKIPYPEKTKVTWPVLIEAPIEIPEKEPIPVVRNHKVPGPKIKVPCGVPTHGTPYLPAPCPPCPHQPCQTCRKCEMKGYHYPKPVVPY